MEEPTKCYEFCMLKISFVNVWPSSKNKVPNLVKPNFSFKDEIFSRLV